MFRVAAAPTKGFRPLGHAADQLADRERLAGFRIDGRFVLDAQRDGIHAELLGKFVHRHFQAEHARGLARRTHGTSARQVELYQSVARQPVRRRVEAAREIGGVFHKPALAVAVGGGHEGEGVERAVRLGPQQHPHHRRWAMDRPVHHVLARIGHLHGPAKRAGAQRGQGEIVVGLALAAEAAADVAGQQMDGVAVDLQGFRKAVLGRLHHLDRGMHDALFAVPPRQGGAGLHLAMVLNRRVPRLVDLHRRGGIARGEIADLGVFLAVRLDGIVEMSAEVDLLGLLLIGQLHQVGGGLGVFEGVGHHEGHRLAEEGHAVVLQHRPCR